MHGPEIITSMVLKYMGMSSSDQIPIHENWCLTLKVFTFSDGCLGLGNENVYINHSCWSYCSASFCKGISHSVYLICRFQIRQTLTNIYTIMKKKIGRDKIVLK